MNLPLDRTSESDVSSEFSFVPFANAAQSAADNTNATNIAFFILFSPVLGYKMIRFAWGEVPMRCVRLMQNVLVLLLQGLDLRKVGFDPVEVTLPAIKAAAAKLFH